MDLSTTLDIAKHMKIAIAEAKLSLREGNHGFGAVIVRDNVVIAQSHDTEETDQDATAHAEINAMRKASESLGKNLSGCVLLSTHEPCPMCSAAMIWANIDHIAFGYSISEALDQGRKRIDMSCEELFRKANVEVRIEKGVLKSECSILYNQDVRAEIKKLRNASEKQLLFYDHQRTEKRVQWYRSQLSNMDHSGDNELLKAYQLLLKRLHATEADCPVIYTDEKKIVFHSANFCPTLEACKILQLDTKITCKLYNEGSTDRLVKEISPKLRFSRNYEQIRPYGEYCEERIEYEE